MFQNALRAKEKAEKVRQTYLTGGANKGYADRMAKLAESRELKRLDAWARNNVGLD